MTGIAPPLRDRAAIESDLRCGLRSLAHAADALEHRSVTPSDITSIDATLRGLSRCLTDLRAAREPEGARG